MSSSIFNNEDMVKLGKPTEDKTSDSNKVPSFRVYFLLNLKEILNRPPFVKKIDIFTESGLLSLLHSYSYTKPPPRFKLPPSKLFIEEDPRKMLDRLEKELENISHLRAKLNATTLYDPEFKFIKERLKIINNPAASNGELSPLSFVSKSETKMSKD